MTLRILIVRHGESEDNTRGITQGQRQGALSTLGHAQAERLGQRLKNEAITVVYTSDLHRAVQTAEAILRHHSGAEVIRTPFLRERHGGIFQGGPREVARAAQEASGRSFSEYQAPEGESFLDVQRRATEFFSGLQTKHQQGTVLVVAHGGLITSLLLALQEYPFTREKYRALHPKNAAISILEVHENGAVDFIDINSTTHL
jgi:alpha-ribazole phosphatase